MARDQAKIICPAGEWTQLTNGDVTNITFQVRFGFAEIHFTTDATAPSDDEIGIIYAEGQGELNTALSSLTNLSGADRVWARGFNTGAEVYVDHA